MSPDQLARFRRAHFARRLLNDTDLTVVDISFAAGFGSLRQLNWTMRAVVRASPTDLRLRRHRADRLAADGGLTLRLPVVRGYDWDAMRAFLAARLVPRRRGGRPGYLPAGDHYGRRAWPLGGLP